MTKTVYVCSEPNAHVCSICRRKSPDAPRRCFFCGEPVRIVEVEVV